MNLKKIKESVNFVKNNISIMPEIGVILGSGLGDLAEEIENKEIIKYSDIPNMPASTIKGHKGQFVVGTLKGKKVIMMQGRVHYYEGNKMSDVVLPVYIMKQLGVKNLIVTNAAGGVNENYNPGDLMLIEDHINFSFNNPLIGENDEEIGPRFPDMSQAYSKKLIMIAEEEAKKLGFSFQNGVYAMMTGPCYETPAEIRMLRKLGADAVGMSTVPEVIAANHCGIKVLGISCITNMAAGILEQPLNHKEVIETSNKVRAEFISLLKSILAAI
ncbi:purine-nucleoside phosphorylase [Clostridium sp. Marseille-Q2269]|uniref:purine-nucleoside phosphorylase n=1 Tax=Clostridium sp. Marseille-Q2269 TaxID=2942205 RepID=UPI0020745059|nr:purine-nucleoside phosphorylase [Clostridium sp. Marseille-Q2269]